MKILRSRLYEAEREKQTAERSAVRKSQVGTGDRSGKIRTYNFPQNRLTDHRLSGEEKNFNLSAALGGDLDALVDALHMAQQSALLRGESGEL